MLALEPKNFTSDNFSRVSQTYRVTQYNVACCYAAMDQARCVDTKPNPYPDWLKCSSASDCDD